MLVVVPSLAGGGAERVVVTLLRHFDRSRLELTLAVVNLREAAYAADLPQDVELIDLQCPRVRHAIPRIAGLLRQRRPDVVLSTIGHLNLALALLRPFVPRAVRFVARETVVLSEVMPDVRFAALWRWGYRRLYGRFDHVICQSRDMYQDLVANFGVEARRATVINNPVDTEWVRRRAAEGADLGPLLGGERPADGIRLVAAGRLVRQKGFDLLLDALAASRRPGVTVTILGEGPLRAELHARAVALGVSQRVHFAGFQANPYPFFRAADAYVLSSRYEGFSNTVVEALACGTPVLALPAPGGTREILDAAPGCAVAPEVTSAALARLLDEFVPSGRIDAGVDARFGAPAIARRYTEILTSRHS